jgi:hypothetical protein
MHRSVFVLQLLLYLLQRKILCLFYFSSGLS